MSPQWWHSHHPTNNVYDKLADMKQPSLADIKRHYVVEGRSLDAATEAALKEDPSPRGRRDFAGDCTAAV